MRGLQHELDPVTLRVQCGLPRARRLLGVEWFAEARGIFFACGVAPFRLATVGEEDHGAHHAVFERVGIAVGVVGLRDEVALAVLVVAHKRDLRVIGAKGRTGEREPVLHIVVSLVDAVAPALRVARVVDLVQDDHTAARRGHRVVLEGVHAHLCVGDHDTVVGRVDRRRICKVRIERQPEALRGVGPLVLQVLGGHDNDEALDSLVG